MQHLCNVVIIRHWSVDIHDYLSTCQSQGTFRPLTDKVWGRCCVLKLGSCTCMHACMHAHTHTHTHTHTLDYWTARGLSSVVSLQGSETRSLHQWHHNLRLPDWSNWRGRIPHCRYLHNSTLDCPAPPKGAPWWHSGEVMWLGYGHVMLRWSTWVTGLLEWGSSSNIKLSWNYCRSENFRTAVRNVHTFNFCRMAKWWKLNPRVRHV